MYMQYTCRYVCVYMCDSTVYNVIVVAYMSLTDNCVQMYGALTQLHSLSHSLILSLSLSFLSLISLSLSLSLCLLSPWPLSFQ